MKKIIAGANAHICHEFVGLCSDIGVEELGAGVRYPVFGSAPRRMVVEGGE